MASLMFAHLRKGGTKQVFSTVPFPMPARSWPMVSKRGPCELQPDVFSQCLKVYFTCPCREFIEVEPLPSSSRRLPLSLSFPLEFLGDKRTAYKQNLILNLSTQLIGSVGSGGVSHCEVTLEFESGDSFRTKHKLKTMLPRIGETQTYIRVGNNVCVYLKLLFHKPHLNPRFI